MEYQEFKVVIQKRMQAMMGESIEVLFEKYFKNNQVEIETMTFAERNPRFKETVSPLINMRDLYEVYRQDGDGEELEECLHLIKELYERQEPKSRNGIAANWGEIKGKIFPVLLHKEWNEEWLRKEEIPYKSYLDFAIILRRISETVLQGIGSLVVTRELIDYWGIEEKKLWDAAWENLKQERFYIQDLDGIVRFEAQADGKDIKELDFTNVPSMYVMTNKERYYGARAMLRTDLLQEFAEKMDCNLFILPASMHDIILVPDCGNLKTEKLRQDVREVNAGCVAEQERLSDELYYYRKGIENHRSGCSVFKGCRRR